MATKADFAEVEWKFVANAPHLASMAVMMAGASGLFGSLKEAVVAAKGVFDATGNANELIRSIASKDEMQAAQSRIREEIGNIGDQDPKAWVRGHALSELREAVAMLQRKAPDDLADYRAWVNSLADGVANAAKEGAFLGFGGERVSAAEKQMMAEIATALG